MAQNPVGPKKGKKGGSGGAPHHGPRPGRQRREAERGASRGGPLGLVIWHCREAINAVRSSSPDEQRKVATRRRGEDEVAGASRLRRREEFGKAVTEATPSVPAVVEEDAEAMR